MKVCIVGVPPTRRPPRCEWGPVIFLATAFRWKARSEASLRHSWERFRAVRASCDLPDSSQLIMEEQLMPDPHSTRHATEAGR